MTVTVIFTKRYIDSFEPIDCSFLLFLPFYCSKSIQWFKSVESFIIVYSITSANSFDAVQSFVEEIEKVRKSKAFPFIIVGTQGNEKV